MTGDCCVCATDAGRCTGLDAAAVGGREGGRGGDGVLVARGAYCCICGGIAGTVPVGATDGGRGV